MTVFMIRHGVAGRRSEFEGDDLARPLDPLGQQQSVDIADRLEDRSVNRLLSSPARRCVETLEPLADRLGIEVEIHESLGEGTRTADAVELVKGLADTRAAVVCSHGDLIPEVIGTLMAEGTVLRGRQGNAKGSVWELETRGRDIVSARYHEARAAAAAEPELG